jgi:hypothetical protein
LLLAIPQLLWLTHVLSLEGHKVGLLVAIGLDPTLERTILLILLELGYLNLVVHHWPLRVWSLGTLCQLTVLLLRHVASNITAAITTRLYCHGLVRDNGFTLLSNTILIIATAQQLHWSAWRDHWG